MPDDGNYTNRGLYGIMTPGISVYSQLVQPDIIKNRGNAYHAIQKETQAFYDKKG